MKTILDIQEMLKKFGTFIYIGDRLADLELMEQEVRELYRSHCITAEDYQMSILLLRQEASKWKKE
ncbi:YqgQ family protein [Pontibacillus litoralis]|uniref:YqgQ family protein n=1 Tax=Pontibacillus litoralis TaxID=516703 RepID=UPI000562B9D7|nr:YqgQ family protein [Pontibacillus litoralis]